MSPTRSPRRRLTALAMVALAPLAISACSRGSEAAETSASSSAGQAAAAGACADVVAKAKAAVDKASAKDSAWEGPTQGPKAVPGKSIVYVAQSMTNPGVAGAAKGVEEGAKAIGWNVRVIDGQGTPAGIQGAFSQALASKPDGIVIGGFDPGSTAAQVTQANAAGIPLVGWQALATPGPSESPKLFSNVTTKVEDVAKISADYIIARSNGTAGVVIFTDKSIPFAAGKSDMIEKELRTCSSVKVLETQNIPLADVSARTPQQVSALLNKYADKWNYSVAINDVYFENAAPALRAAGKKSTDIVNVGAGDGDASAMQRIRSDQFQSATVPSPLRSEGWQIVDELNRAFAKQPASGYVPQVHVTTKDNVGTTDAWDPSGFESAYQKIWGR